MERRSAFCVGVVNTKGGVGKTTLAANLGAICADLGHRVLLVDADPQGSLSSYFKIERQADVGLSGVLRQRRIDGSMVSATAIDGLDILLHDAAMPAALTEHSSSFRPEQVLERALQTLRDDDLYDLVIIDTPGASGLLQDIGIVPSELLVAPVIPETLSANQVDPLLALLRRYEQGDPNGRLAAVPCRVVVSQAVNTGNARELTSALRARFLEARGRFSISQTVIARSAIFDKAAKARTAVHRIEPSPKGEMGQATRSLRALTAELFPHLYDRVHGETP
jgi:chromosome partitioning related protein ParA